MDNASENGAVTANQGGLFQGVQDVLPFGVARAEMQACADLAASNTERQRRWESEHSRHRAGFGQHKTIAEYAECPDCSPGR